MSSEYCQCKYHSTAYLSNIVDTGCIHSIILPTIILQPLGDVDSLNISSLLEWPHIQDELVGYKTCSDQDTGFTLEES